MAQVLPFQLVVAMPKPSSIEGLLGKYPLVSDQVDERELRIILGELAACLKDAGQHDSVVELGCYIGTTSLFIRRLLDMADHPAEFHVYDSFVGLPEKTDKDRSPAGEQFRAGELAVSRKAFELQFKKAGLKTPVIHKGWFHNLSTDDVPNSVIFAYLDGDYYESILTSLELVWPHLATGARIVVDDYTNEALPGAARAVNEWMSSHPARLRVEASLAIIRP